MALRDASCERMNRFRKLLLQTGKLLTSGMTPEKWAASAAFGLIAALFPIIGPTTLICIVICWIARLHLPLVLLILYGLYPVQIALIVPFTMLGSYFTHWQIPADFGLHDVLKISKRFGEQAIQWGIAAIIGWAICTLPLSYLLYRLLLSYARRKMSVA